MMQDNVSIEINKKITSHTKKTRLYHVKARNFIKKTDEKRNKVKNKEYIKEKKIKEDQ